MLGNSVFLYKTYLTFMIEIVITISHDEFIFIIQMRCWLLKLEDHKKNNTRRKSSSLMKAWNEEILVDLLQLEFLKPQL
jgi:hypothetical protein